MICLSDKAYCSRSECTTLTCTRHFNHAQVLKENHPDPFIRDTIPICVSDFSKECGYYRIKGEVK